MILTRALCAEKEEGEYLRRPVSASSKTRSGVSVPKADNPDHQTGEMPGDSWQDQEEGRAGPRGAAAEALPHPHRARAHGKSGPLPHDSPSSPCAPWPLPLESRWLNTWLYPRTWSYLQGFNPLQAWYQSFNNSHGCFCEKPLS